MGDVIERLRALYAPGTRVEFVWTDGLEQLGPGSLGTVHSVDDEGTVHVRWDEGSTLAMVPGVDVFRIIETAP